jgi:hypothetical protein
MRRRLLLQVFFSGTWGRCMDAVLFQPAANAAFVALDALVFLLVSFDN